MTYVVKNLRITKTKSGSYTVSAQTNMSLENFTDYVKGLIESKKKETK